MDQEISNGHIDVDVDAESPASKKIKKEHKIDDNTSIEEFAKQGIAEVIRATQTVNSFPSGSSRDLYCSYPTFGRIIDAQSYRIMGIISKILKIQNIKGNIQRRHQDEQFDMLLECNDAMLERVNSNLDELAGVKNNPPPIVIEARLDRPTAGKGAGSWNKNTRNEATSNTARLITAKNIARPQIKYKMSIDNSMKTPFTPQIKYKPNSLKPLAVLPEYDDFGNIASYLHPYEYELMKFEPKEPQLTKKTPVEPPPMEETEFVYVDTVEKLQAAVNEMKKYQEIGVDVEHHSYRTFMGITCLIQISTRDKDYILDSLELRDELHALNEVFTDPKIVKILHGADHDIEWLQRDHAVYIVNMFDTHQAAKALGLERLSLAYLLKNYCDIEANKTFQLADWRIRPLPQELITYARQDTHNLIYIYERMTNELLEKANYQTNILRSIYQLSTEICKKRYVKPIIDDESHLDMYQRAKQLYDNRQMFALKEIYRWRDTIARQEDESYGYVLPNQMLLQISESLPREMQGVLACCNPVPPLVRQNLHVLHQIILQAREEPLVKPISERDYSRIEPSAVNINEPSSRMYFLHDGVLSAEVRDDLPTLISSAELQKKTMSSPKASLLLKPALSVFDTPDNSEEEAAEIARNLKRVKFVSPHARYLAALPLIALEELEEQKRIAEENRRKLLCPLKVEKPISSVSSPVTKPEPDDMYTIPLKESLKRKRTNTSQSAQSPQTKKVKKEPPPTVAEEPTETADAPAVQPVTDNDALPSTSKPGPGRQAKNGNKKKNKFKKFKGNKAGQSSEKAVAFDYKKVDFKKFQGGAQKTKGTELKPKFHGKGNSNKANNKKFNKMFSFSNANKKK